MAEPTFDLVVRSRCTPPAGGSTEKTAAPADAGERLAVVDSERLHLLEEIGRSIVRRGGEKSGETDDLPISADVRIA